MTDGAPGALAAAFVSALLASSLAARALERPGARAGLLDRPGGRKLHERPIPLVGGIALLIGAATCVGVAALLRSDRLGTFDRRLLLVPLGGFAIGLVDDLLGKRTSAPRKAAATALLLAFAAPPALAAGERIGWSCAAFVALHAMNTVDHANGLAGLSAAIGAAALALAAAATGGGLALPAAAIAGAAAGFLFLNFPRARVFLGDSGTLLLGGALAALLLEQRRPELLLLAAVPLADLLTVAWLRARAGARPWVGDRRHVTHRLVERGVGEARAVTLLAAVQVACSAAAAVALVRRPAPGAAWGLVLAVIGAVALGMLCVTSVPPRVAAGADDRRGS